MTPEQESEIRLRVANHRHESTTSMLLTEIDRLRALLVKRETAKEALTRLGMAQTNRVDCVDGDWFPDIYR